MNFLSQYCIYDFSCCSVWIQNRKKPENSAFVVQKKTDVIDVTKKVTNIEIWLEEFKYGGETREVIIADLKI